MSRRLAIHESKFLPFVIESGKISFKVLYKNHSKDNFTEEFHENGQLASKGVYKNGLMEGIWEFFNSDGSINTKPLKIGNRVYHEGAGIYQNGRKVG